MKILIGNCLETLPTLDEQSVNCCVTSPPYWGLRDYGLPATTWGDGWIGCLGLEPTPEMFVGHLVEVFRQVRRVLRDDGTLWLNLGDSYSNPTSGRNDGGSTYGDNYHRKSYGKRKTIRAGLKPKDLVGIPWMVAFALRADGWYLRQDIIWNKPAPMPESVTDRCTKAHEYVFLLSKSARYYYDHEAIKEPAAYAGRTVKSSGADAKNAQKGEFGATAAGFTQHDTVVGETRNKRSVWTVNPKPYPKAHFATYPPDLIRPCILAGSPVGGTVLDPFGGSGTTASVAIEHGRKAIVCELNSEYVGFINDRISNTQPLLFP